VSRTKRLTVVLVLNLGLVAALVVVGLTAHSLAVFAEGGDYLLDAAGVAVALFAIRLSARPRPPGRPAATDLAALVNCGWLLLLEVLVAAAATERLVTRTPEVHGLPVLVVSGIAALTMTAGALVLRPMPTMTTGVTGVTCPSPRSCSTPSPMPPQRPASRPPAGSSWPPAAGTGSTPRPGRSASCRRAVGRRGWGSRSVARAGQWQPGWSATGTPTRSPAGGGRRTARRRRGIWLATR
jgi:hypothetical protein